MKLKVLLNERTNAHGERDANGVFSTTSSSRWFRRRGSMEQAKCLLLALAYINFDQSISCLIYIRRLFVKCWTRYWTHTAVYLPVFLTAILRINDAEQLSGA